MKENDLMGRLRSVKSYFLLAQGDFMVSLAFSYQIFEFEVLFYLNSLYYFHIFIYFYMYKKIYLILYFIGSIYELV